jgi:hypothetical protein
MRRRVHISGEEAVKRLGAACVLAASLLLPAAAPAGADAPTQLGPVTETFADVNPCTGLAQTGMLVVTFYVHSEDGRIVARGDRTLSTTVASSVRGLRHTSSTARLRCSGSPTS